MTSTVSDCIARLYPAAEQDTMSERWRTMTATPRTVRAITSTGRLQRVARVARVAQVTTRPVGTISLFLVATAVLGLTSLFFLWQSGQATTTAYRIDALNTRLLSLESDRAQLQSEIYQMPAKVLQTATTKYGMSVVNSNVQRSIDVPAPPPAQALAQTALSSGLGVARPQDASVAVRLDTTNTTPGTWWQALWSGLAGLTASH